MTVTDPIKTAARAAAKRLTADYGFNLPSDVEAVLHGEETVQRRNQYPDLVSVASLIVAVATLAWTIYNDLRMKTSEHPAEDVADEVRSALKDQTDSRHSSTDLIISVVVEEVIQTAEHPP
jgi:hypothetical protein